jgi:arginine-tRNA-protein transferase
VSETPPAEPTPARLAALVDALGLEPSPEADCPYLADRRSRVVAIRPERLSPALYHSFLELNYRRLGDIVYRPACVSCQACRQLRVRVADFAPSRAQRRCLRRNAELRAECRPPQPQRETHEIYRRYLLRRHDGQMSGSWPEFLDLVGAVTPFTEEVLFHGPRGLVGAGLFDATEEALSAVYFYFDPGEARRSPGVFNVLWLVEECRRRRLPWLYLGYWVAASRRMAYKATFRPHQILGEDGRWR